MKSGRMKRILLSVIAFLFVGCSIAGGTVLLSNTSISDSNRGGDSTSSENEITKNAPTNTSGTWTSSGRYADSFAGGDGQSEATAYQISTPEQLARLAYLVNNGSEQYMFTNTYFVQTANLDMSEYWWDAIGTYTSSSDYLAFSGRYDGGNFTISGLYTKSGSSSTYSYQGLFGYVEGQSETNKAIIKNVGITDSNIQGYNYIGGVVGRASYSTIANCYNTGNIPGRGYSLASVGGVVGEAIYSVVTNCYNTGTVSGRDGYVGGVVGEAIYSVVTNCYNTGKVTGGGQVGGVVGFAREGSTVTNCYNTGSVTCSAIYVSEGAVGGVVGLAYGAITNCYNTGTVSGSKSNVGGVVGRVGSSTITNCYNTGSVTGDQYVGGVVGRGSNSTIINCYYGGNCTLSYGIGSSSSNTGASKDGNLIANAKSLSWYQDSSKWDSEYPWDFDNVWTIVPRVNDGFPILQYAVDDIMRESGIVSEIYNDAEGKMDEENVGRLLEYLLGESDVDVTAKETMDKLNALAGSTMTSADIRDKNDGTDITVRFGGLDWTVTYLSKDNAGNNILTLWLSSSQQDAFAGRTATEGTLYGFINNSLYSDWSNDWLSTTPDVNYPSNMYGTSYIRAVTLNNGGIYTTDGTNTATASQNTNSVFARFTMDEVDNSLTKFLVKPGKIEWQRYQSAAELLWHSKNLLPNESINVPSSGSYVDGFNYHSIENYDAWANDYIWLPSLSETGSGDNLNGLWKASISQRQNFSSSTESYGNVGTNNKLYLGSYNYTWLRSGGEDNSAFAYDITPSADTAYPGDVTASRAVRPALHLNLNDVIKNILGIYTLTLDDNGGSGGAEEIFVSRDGYYADEGMATKIEGVTVPSFTAHKFLGYFTADGMQVTDANGVLTMTSSQFTEATTLYAHWEARNPAYYDSEGGFWYVKNGKLPQSKVGDSLKSTLSGQWGSLSDGSVYYMGVEELAENDLTEDGGMQSKVYNGEEYVKFNGEYYLVEPIRWRLVYSSSQQEGYAVEDTSILATMAEIVFLGSYSSTKIGVGAGYSAESVTMLLKNQVSTEFLVNESREVKIFGAPKDTTTASGSVFVASMEELANFTTSKNNTTGSGVKAGKASFSDFVKDYLRATGQGNYYFTRDLGDQLNTIRCLNPVGDRSQAKAQQTLGVQFTIKVTEYACKSV